jgi:hypothetical protein
VGYKLLGYVVWNGGRWYLRRRIAPERDKLIFAGVSALVAAAAVAGAWADRRPAR